MRLRAFSRRAAGSQLEGTRFESQRTLRETRRSKPWAHPRHRASEPSRHCGQPNGETPSTISKCCQLRVALLRAATTGHHPTRDHTYRCGLGGGRLPEGEYRELRRPFPARLKVRSTAGSCRHRLFARSSQPTGQLSNQLACQLDPTPAAEAGRRGRATTETSPSMTAAAEPSPSIDEAHPDLATRPRPTHRVSRGSGKDRRRRGTTRDEAR